MKNILIIILLGIIFITTGCMKSREINADELYILNYISTDKRLPEKARLLINKTLEKETVRKAEAHILIENAALYVPELEGWIKQYKQEQLIHIILLGAVIVSLGCVSFRPGQLAIGILVVCLTGVIVFSMHISHKSIEEFLKSDTPQIEHRTEE